MIIKVQTYVYIDVKDHDQAEVATAEEIAERGLEEA